MRTEIRVFSPPCWAVTKWLLYAGRDVPEYIQAALLRTLYGTMPIFFGGVVNTIAVSALIAARHFHGLFIAWLVMEVALCFIRMILLFNGLRAAESGRRTQTDIFILLGVLWAFSVGYGSFISLMSGDWVAATLACLSAAGMVGGMCFRNFGAPRMVAVMIVLSLGPCAIGGMMSGQPLLLIVLLQIPAYAASMTAAAFHLNKMMVTTMLAERENDYRARHDVLTGLSNRAGLMQELERSAAAIHDGERHTLFYLDLDGFKAVNDGYGHAAGDRLLWLVAERLRKMTRSNDVVARIGGDEFVIISREVERSSALKFGERIVAIVAGDSYDIGDAVVAIGISVGIALLPEHGEDFESLMAAADSALYIAKSKGGMRCAIASTLRSVPQDGKSASDVTMTAPASQTNEAVGNA